MDLKILFKNVYEDPTKRLKWINLFLLQL